jgi:hypothetical protein
MHRRSKKCKDRMGNPRFYLGSKKQRTSMELPISLLRTQPEISDCLPIATLAQYFIRRMLISDICQLWLRDGFPSLRPAAFRPICALEPQRAQRFRWINRDHDVQREYIDSRFR